MQDIKLKRSLGRIFGKLLYYNYAWLALLLLLALLLRLKGLTTFGLHNDELSAIFRAGYKPFSFLIEQGVKIEDTHPAGIQVLMWLYAPIAGSSDFLWRLPFALSGVAACWMMFCWVKRLYGGTAATWATALVCCLQIAIYYSQYARGYMPGTLLYIVLLYFLAHRRVSIVGAGAAMAGLAYTHYLAALFGAATLAVCFLLYPVQRKRIFWAVLLSAVLYLPHLPITYYHVTLGGLGWAGKPTPAILLDMLWFMLQRSWVAFAALALPFVLGLAVRKRAFALRREQWAMLLSFVVAVAVMYVKSVLGAAVLQYSSLMFGLPLLVGFFSRYARITTYRTFHSLLMVATLALLLGSLFFEQYYSKERLPLFKPLAAKLVEWHQAYPDLVAFSDFIRPFYINYYLPEATQGTFHTYSTYGVEATDSAINLLLENRPETAAYLWSNVLDNQELIAFMGTAYGYQEFDSHFVSGAYLFRQWEGLPQPTIAQDSFPQEGALFYSENPDTLKGKKLLVHLEHEEYEGPRELSLGGGPPEGAVFWKSLTIRGSDTWLVVPEMPALPPGSTLALFFYGDGDLPELKRLRVYVD